MDFETLKVPREGGRRSVCGHSDAAHESAGTRIDPLLVCVSIFAVLIGMPCSSRSQTPAGDVAAQVRSQGYACDEPVTAKRDVRLSKPDLAVWVLNCRNAIYRVRLYPNLAAHVVKLKYYH